MNRSGSGVPPLRGLSGNAFHGQQQSTGRNGSLGSGRLQNGKLSNTTNSWGFPNLGAGGAPSLPSPHQRTNPLSSFASTIGGSQSQASLDLSTGARKVQVFRYPSAEEVAQCGLVAASQEKARELGWLEAVQDCPDPPSGTSELTCDVNDDSEFPSLSGAPRTQQSSNPQNLWNSAPLRSAQPGPAQRTQGSSQTQASEAQSTSNQRQSEQIGNSQTQSYAQFNSGSAQVAANVNSAGEGSYNLLSNNPRSQPGLIERIESNQDATSTSRPSADNRFLEREDTQNINASTTQLAFRHNAVDDRQQHNGDAQSQDESGGSQMTPAERYGLEGFLSRLRNGSADQQGLMLGMDLNQLGLDLHRAEPLYSDYPGPWAAMDERPIVPDFSLPLAYKVSNVPPLKNRISSFSDETLFAIFYQNPRDKSQEWAAAELYNRDWRWHKELRCWMMKAKEFGEPVPLPGRGQERGFYYFFDVNLWKRDRREYVLAYDDLYHQPQPQNQQPAGASLMAS